jgi:hypothetical protein
MEQTRVAVTVQSGIGPLARARYSSLLPEYRDLRHERALKFCCSTLLSYRYRSANFNANFFG